MAVCISTFRTGRGDDVQLALGLLWQRKHGALVGEDAVADAHRVAASAKSTHVVIGKADADGSVEIVGHGVLPKTTGEVFSAAFAFQLSRKAQGGISIAVMALSDEECWVCAVTEGLIAAKYDLVVGRDQVIPTLDEFARQRGVTFDTIRFFGDVLSQSEEYTFTDLAQYASRECFETAQLVKVHSRVRIPKRALGLVAVLAVAGAGYEGWQQYQAIQRARATAAETASMVPEKPASVVWSEAVSAWSQEVYLTQHAAFQAVLQRMEGLRTSVAEWEIRSASCRQPPSDARWTCEVEYQRSTDSKTTANAFLAALGGTDSVQFKTLTTATLTFSVEKVATRIEVKDLPDRDAIDLSVLSGLQFSAGKFRSVGNRPVFAAVMIPLPKKEDGSPYQLDRNKVRPLILSADVNVSGPVRSLHLLKDLPISWSQFVITFRPDVKPNGKESMVSFDSLKGVVYAAKH